MVKKSSRLTKAILETTKNMRKIGIMDEESYVKITMRHLIRKNFQKVNSYKERFMKHGLRLLTMSMLFLLPSMKGWAEFENTPKLVVRGEASIFKPADQMEISLGVVTAAENSSEALNENNQRMRQILVNLQELGLEPSEYQTGRFQIRPIYRKPAKVSEEEERTVITHYEVINAIQVKTQKLALADRILSRAVQGGANQVEQVNFNLHNPQDYRAEAIELATKYAFADAAVLAHAAGVKIMRVLNLSLDHWQHVPRPLMLGKYSSHAGGETQEVLEPGQTEIHATVNVTIEIGSQ